MFFTLSYDYRILSANISILSYAIFIFLMPHHISHRASWVARVFWFPSTISQCLPSFNGYLYHDMNLILPILFSSQMYNWRNCLCIFIYFSHAFIFSIYLYLIYYSCKNLFCLNATELTKLKSQLPKVSHIICKAQHFT